MQAYDLVDETETITTLTLHQQQRQIKQDIERDIQRQLQQMLGRLLGMDNVVVSVFASIDFTKEQREEHLVAPVVGNNGIDISVERNNKSYIGESGNLGGIAGTG